MRRYILKLYDKSTAGGVVVEGMDHFTHHGTPVTFVGAKVNCPACKTIGFIGARGPRWPSDIMGKEEALSDDLCYCECQPRPVMIESQRNSFHEFDGAALAKMGFTPQGDRLERPAAPAPVFDECVVLVDVTTGRPQANVSYRFMNGSSIIAEGRTDSDGKTARMSHLSAATYELFIKGSA